MARRKAARVKCDCRRKGMRNSPCCAAKRRAKTERVQRSTKRPPRRRTSFTVGTRTTIGTRTIKVEPFRFEAPAAVDPFSIPDVVFSPGAVAAMKAEGRWTAADEANQQKVEAWLRGEPVRFDGRRRG